MSSVVLDTHVLVWLVQGVRRLGSSSRRLIDRSLREDCLHVSAVTFWEVAMLQARGKLRLRQSASAWRETALQFGVGEIPLDGEIALRAAELAGFHADPGDRFIAATAASRGAILLTSDGSILSWPGQLLRHDAGA